MSKTRQISITLRTGLIDLVKAAVARGEARSVSAYIASQLSPGMIMDEMFAEWDTERGAPSPEVRAKARLELDRALA